MICKERGMGLPWFSTKSHYDLTLLSKQDRSQLIYSSELTTEHVFENFGGDCPLALPLIAGSANKTCQHHLSCKRLGSHPKRSIKPCLPLVFFSQWTLIIHKPDNYVDLYVDTATDNLLELEHHAGFAKLTRWIMKTRHRKYSFAFSIHSDIRTKF